MLASYRLGRWRVEEILLRDISVLAVPSYIGGYCETDGTKWLDQKFSRPVLSSAIFSESKYSQCLRSIGYAVKVGIKKYS